MYYVSLGMGYCVPSLSRVQWFVELTLSHLLGGFSVNLSNLKVSF